MTSAPVSVGTDLVAEGLRYSAEVARTQARTFYVAFRLLPTERRLAMCTLYAFSRAVDDVADAPGLTLDERRRQLAAWHRAIDLALAGEATGDQPPQVSMGPARRPAEGPHRRGDERPAVETPVPATTAPVIAHLAALAAVAERHGIPAAMLHTLVDGVAMDLEPQRFPDLAALRHYCHAVAGVVGQMCMRILGAQGDVADGDADELGFALQLTNILRDVAEDAAVGRFYLPREDLAAFGVEEEDVLAFRGEPTSPVFALLSLEGDRAAAAFTAVHRLLPLVPRSSRPCLRGIADLYATLLGELRARRFAVAAPKVRLPTHRKVGVALGAVLRGVAG